MGSGTTALAARDSGRNSIGYDINQNFRLFYQEKVIATNPSKDNSFEFAVDNTIISLNECKEKLPYLFEDVHKIDKQVDVKQNTYGSKFSVDENVHNELVESDIPDTWSKLNDEPTVLVNHVAPEMMDLSIREGITYVRAGESKGSLLVKEGFENLTYVCLHSNGKSPKLFKLSRKGFQIWTPEALQKLGFSAEHAPYYAVLRFDGNPIEILKPVSIKKGRYTTVAHIQAISEFR